MAGAAVGDTFALFRVLKAFPKFIYPTISGATPAERQFILQTLDSLPLKDVNTVKSLEVVARIPNASGLAEPLQVTNVIKLARDQISIRPEWFKEVVIHEVGHTRDFDSAWFGFIHHNSGHAPWGQAPFVSNYAHTNHWEDYAETHADYFLRPDHLKEVAPEKYRLMHQQEQQNFLEHVIDRPAFRDTGKWLGEHLGPSQGVRTGLQVAFWLTSGIQIMVGLDRLRASTQQQDAAKHADGVLDVAAGTLFASKVMALGGMAVQGAHAALDQAMAGGDIAANDADAAVRMASDPVERAIRAVGSRVGLTAPFSATVAAHEAPAAHRTRAACIAAGGAGGALVGGIAGPYLGIMAGYAAAGPVGGAVGLVAGALAGYAGGSWAGGRLGTAVGKAIDA